MRILFAGPTLARYGAEMQRFAASLHFAGPAVRGDVFRAVQCGAVAIGIVDGRFGDVLSVWHKEILFALSQGVAVGGAASMGALRAAECAAFGMVGVGKIFRDYAEGRRIDDADVAQIHGPAELGYVSLSEPLVNIDCTVNQIFAQRLITEAEMQELRLIARQNHFKTRTYRSIAEAMRSISQFRKHEIIELLERTAIDQKGRDGLELVDWLATVSGSCEQRPSWKFSETTHWRALRQFTGNSAAAAASD